MLPTSSRRFPNSETYCLFGGVVTVSYGTVSTSKESKTAKVWVQAYVRRSKLFDKDEASSDDSFSHYRRRCLLTCENKNRQSHWLRFTSLNRCQRGESTIMASISSCSEPQNLHVFVPGTKIKLRARGFELVCVFVPGIAPSAYAKTRGGIRRQDSRSRRPNRS